MGRHSLKIWILFFILFLSCGKKGELNLTYPITRGEFLKLYIRDVVEETFQHYEPRMGFTVTITADGVLVELFHVQGVDRKSFASKKMKYYYERRAFTSIHIKLENYEWAHDIPIMIFYTNLHFSLSDLDKWPGLKGKIGQENPTEHFDLE